jgi:hypothetical protein
MGGTVTVLELVMVTLAPSVVLKPWPRAKPMEPLKDLFTSLVIVVASKVDCRLGWSVKGGLMGTSIALTLVALEDGSDAEPWTVISRST